MTDHSRPTMEIFTGASGTTIDRSHLSNVGRDQNIYTTIHHNIVQNRGERKLNKDIPDLSEFTEIKRGDIFKDDHVCYSWRLCSNGQDGTEAAVFLAQIMIGGRCENSRFTVKTYRGRNAMKEWRRDFLQCSKDLCGNVPLFGYNKSSLPSLIFHGELVPLAHIEPRLGRMGAHYIDLLISNLGCLADELWMNPIKGNFCRGPTGPECRGTYYDRGVITIPSDVEFLKEDTVVRYLSSTTYYLWFLNALSFRRSIEDPDIPFTTSYPGVISGRTKSIIAFAPTVCWWRTPFSGCLDKFPLELAGASRFYLTDTRRRVGVFSDSGAASWLSQALSIFHAHNISLNEDLSTYKLIFPNFVLGGALKKSKQKRQRRQLCGPIYLFLRLPSAPEDLCSWSLDPTGETALSADMCKYLGLPFHLSLTVSHHQNSWSTQMYKALHNYQVARGFDPTTTDFARACGHHMYEMFVEDLDRFEESSESTTETAPTKRSRLGKLFAPFIRGFRYLTCRNPDAA